MQHKNKKLDDAFYMRAALEQAKMAATIDEVPIGCVIVNPTNGEIVAMGYNQTRQEHDPTQHAEIVAIQRACTQFAAQRIPECDLYVTVEPCPMCAAAISFARIRRVVFGAADPKSGGILQGPCMYTHAQIHHKPEVVQGILADECATLIQEFFQLKRQKKS